MSTSHRTTQGYRIEARVENMNHLHPVKVHDIILTEKWREVNPIFCDNPAGVPDDPCGQMQMENLLPYESALALAHVIVAQRAWSGVETRLVAYDLTVDTVCERKGIVDMPTIGGVMRVARVNVIPEPTMTTPAEVTK